MKRILLITLLMMTGFSGMANAQGAWILWSQIGEGKWDIEEAFTSLEECKEVQRGLCANIERGYETKTGPVSFTSLCPGASYVLVKLDGEEKLLLIIFKCLPDTIDLRK